MIKAVVTTSIALALAPGLSFPAHAYVSDGHEYKLSCNSDGYVLNSLHPVTRVIGSGAASRQVTGKETVYLGSSCDAFHELFGKGKWCWANGGFRATFPDHIFGFPRQELICNAQSTASESCLCN